MSVVTPADWLVPDWPAPPGVRALCTTRAGGVSQGNFSSLNLGAHVGDDNAAVQANRAVLRDAMDARPVFLQQVHGTHVEALQADATASTRVAQADACVTDVAGIACTIMVADCLPVLFADASGGRVAAAHAGWRGLAAGVLERTVEAFAPGAGIVAWLGPCIGPDAFEVGDEVKLAFESTLPSASRHFKPAGSSGKWLADLPGLARDRLRNAGVAGLYGNDGTDAWCTVHNPLRFFSHRRDRVSGRFAACIWRV